MVMRKTLLTCLLGATMWLYGCCADSDSCMPKRTTEVLYRGKIENMNVQVSQTKVYSYFDDSVIMGSTSVAIQDGKDRRWLHDFGSGKLGDQKDDKVQILHPDNSVTTYTLNEVVTRTGQRIRLDDGCFASGVRDSLAKKTKQVFEENSILYKRIMSYVAKKIVG